VGDGDGADDGQSEAMVVVDAGAIESLEGLEEAVEPQSEPVPRRRRGQPPELGRDAEGRALDERIERAAGQLSGPVAQHLPAVPVDSFQSTTPSSSCWSDSG
jgi:hypothetical protein